MKVKLIFVYLLRFNIALEISHLRLAPHRILKRKYTFSYLHRDPRSICKSAQKILIQYCENNF